MRFIIKTIIVLSIAAYFMPEQSRATQGKDASLLSEAGSAIASLFHSFRDDMAKQIVVGQITKRLSNGERAKSTLTENDLLPAWQGGKNRLSDAHVRRN